MASPHPDAPYRQHLRDVRRAYFRLHKALVDAERAAFERLHGPVSGGHFLQALFEDPTLAWLRPFTALLVEVDEALAGDLLSAAEAGEFVARIRGLVAPAELPAEVHFRYEEVSRRDPGVLLRHVELTDALDAPIAS